MPDYRRLTTTGVLSSIEEYIDEYFYNNQRGQRFLHTHKVSFDDGNTTTVLRPHLKTPPIYETIVTRRNIEVPNVHSKYIK